MFFPNLNQLLKNSKTVSQSEVESSKENKSVSDTSACANKPKQSVLLSTSPYKPETHWKQSVLYLDEEISVKQDFQITGSVSLSPHVSNPRFLTINLSCQVQDGDVLKKEYFMGYEAPKTDDKL